MVKIAGKEITQDELDKFIADKTASDALIKGLENKVNELEGKTEGLSELETIKKELEESKAINYKTTLNSRLGQITKYLDKRGNSEDIIKKIGDMSDEDFEFFAEGKTDSELLTKDEIESAKTDLEKKETEIDNSRDKIIKDYLKSLDDANKTKNDQNLVPKGEIDADDTDEETDDGFPTMDKLKDIYNLHNNPMFDKNERMVKNAEIYLSQYGDKPTVL